MSVDVDPEQTSLDDSFPHEKEEAEEEHKDSEEDGAVTENTVWEPDTGARVQCKNCGKTVSQQWAKVNGDNNDEIHACPRCSTYREVEGGKAARGEI